MKSWLPLLDRILLRQDEAPMLHPGTGIAMSEQDRIKYRPNTGKVVKVGPGRRHDDGQVYPVAIPEGAHVMFSSTGGTEVEHEGVPHLMMREADVFLVLSTPESPIKAIAEPAQFCISQNPWMFDGRGIVLATIDKESAQNTYEPKLNDRFQSYNGMVFRLLGKRDNAVLEFAGEDEALVSKHDLLDVLTFHAKNAVPIAYIGPRLH